jgi:uncharacterized protein YjiS (DUF1127 family)
MAGFRSKALPGALGCLYCGAHKETLKTERNRKDMDMTTASAALTGLPVLAAGAEQRRDTFAARASQAWKRFRAYRATRVDLQALTDRQLADVGLTRATVEEAARHAVYGR